MADLIVCLSVLIYGTLLSNPLSDIGGATPEPHSGHGALHQKRDSFAIYKSYLCQVQNDSLIRAFGFQEVLQLRQMFGSDSASEYEDRGSFMRVRRSLNF